MSYLPPHLRKDSAAVSETGATDGGSSFRSDRGGSFGGGGGGGGSGGFRSGGSGYSSRLPHSSSQASIGSGAGSLSRSGSSAQVNNEQGPRSGMSRSGSTATIKIDPVFLDWQPSDRVLALKEEQINEIKQRLSIKVEVREGQPPAASPIESFQDMEAFVDVSDARMNPSFGASEQQAALQCYLLAAPPDVESSERAAIVSTLHHTSALLHHTSALTHHTSALT
eukprot:gene28737-31915_t